MELKSLLLILFSCIFMRPLKVAMVTAPKYTDEKYRHTKNQRPGYVIKKKSAKVTESVLESRLLSAILTRSHFKSGNTERRGGGRGGGNPNTQTSFKLHEPVRLLIRI